MTIRHVCETQGCYIKKMTPDWGFLDSAFSGKIRIGDIDGIVEVNGKLLILEWKTEDAPITTGQEIMFKHIATANKLITVLVIWGDPEETIPKKSQLFFNGEVRPKIKADNKTIYTICKDWEAMARI